MNKSVSKQETETVCGLDVPVVVAERLQREHKRRDVDLSDLVNDYIMLDPSVTVTVTNQS